MVESVLVVWVIRNIIVKSMVELMTPDQTNDPGITFEWNGVQKIWIQFWIPLPLPALETRNYVSLTKNGLYSDLGTYNMNYVL